MPRRPGPTGPASTGKAEHVERAEAYVADVLTGRRPACKWERLACERYRRDRKRKADESWPFRFDQAKAERVCRFMELLPHIKGVWAARHELLKLPGWQCFILVNVFGWVRRDNERRRFTEAVTVVPRKNGKSTGSAGIGLYMLAADGEHGAEVYAGAATERQAWEVFRPARLMALGRPDLLAHYQIGVNVSNINIVSKAARFEPMIGKPGDGASPSCAIIDEFHEHDTAEQYDTMLTGMGAREQPLMWVITTAGDNLAGPCFDKLLTCRKILDRAIEDEQKFFIEFTIDQEPYSLILQSSPALERLDKICNCGRVPLTLISQLWQEVCVRAATRDGGASTRLQNVQTILTGGLWPAVCADLAMSNPFLTQTPSERRGQSRRGPSGTGAIPSESAQPARDGALKRGLENTSTTAFAPSNMALPAQTSRNAAHGKMASAQSAERSQRFYAWITATAQELFGESFAKNATPASPFSEILKRVYSEHSPTCAARQAELRDNGTLAITLPADDWTAPEALYKANPNLGISVSEEFLLSRQREAIRNTREQGRFKTKHLNLWVNARAAFFNMQSWTNCRDPDLKLDDFRGRRCKLALDLASKQDIAAMQALFDLGDGTYATFGRYYLPEDIIEEPGLDHYRGWALADPPKLILTEGNMIDFGRIEEDIDDFRLRFQVEEITFDPAQATMLMTRLMAKGANVSEFQQTAAIYTEPMKQVAALIDAGKLRHNCEPNDPMTWMMSNVTARFDGKDQVFPRKERPENKIDGPVALIMAMRLVMGAEPPMDIDDFLKNAVIA